MEVSSTQKNKEPWLAVNLSLFLAGLGQLYAGRVARGGLFIVGQVAPILIGFWLIRIPTGNLFIGLGLILLGGLINIYSLFDVHSSVRKANEAGFEKVRKENKDPWLAVFLSNLLPGIGQFYLKKRLWGIFFLLCWLALTIVTDNRFWPTLLSSLLVTLVCFHAYISSPVRREASNKIILVFSVFVFIFTFGIKSGLSIARSEIKPFRIPTNAMAPTIITGDRLLIKMGENFNPERGDIIVFKYPKNREKLYLKRAVAFGGENIEIKGKSILIDGKKLEERPFNNLRGATSMGKYGVEGKPYLVPSHSIFVLGDNTSTSNDSRFWGAVPEADVIGKAYKRYWPPGRMGPID